MTTPKNATRQLITSLKQHVESGFTENHVLNFVNSGEFNIDDAFTAAHLLMQKEKFDLAARIYSKILELDNKNINALTNLGGALVNLKQYADAEAILRYALELDPHHAPALINIGGSLQGQGKREDVLEMALLAVCASPSQPICHQNLGAAFHDLGSLEEARQSFETALILNPNLVEAEISIATINQQMGKYHQESINRYTRALKIIPKENKMKRELVKFYLGILYLKLGNLKKGWNYFEAGFCQLLPAAAARNPNRIFSKPRWTGEQLNGKTLMVWREQGIGDSIIFSSILNELEELGGRIILEVELRLVKTFQRSFPKFTVREQKFIENSISDVEDYDLQIPLVSLMQYYRNDLASFKNKNTSYITTDPETDAEFSQRLSKFQDKKKIGICWRSGKLDPNRNKEYTHIGDWNEILSNPNHVFVNLQYGDCEQEIQQAENTCAIDIIRWPDVNLKDDFDKVFSIIKNLDAVVSVGSTPFAMGGAVGTPVIVMCRNGWDTFGEKNYPWFNSITPIFAQEDEHMANCLTQVPTLLESILQ